MCRGGKMINIMNLFTITWKPDSTFFSLQELLEGIIQKKGEVRQCIPIQYMTSMDENGNVIHILKEAFVIYAMP